MNLLTAALHWAALRDVYFSNRNLKGVDSDYELRQIFRWYSKTFSTPLHQVVELPLEDVLRAWYEEEFEGMKEEDLEQVVRERAISEERRRELDRLDDVRAARDHDDVAESQAHNAKLPKRLEETILPLQGALADLLRSVRDGREAELVPVTVQKPLPGLQPDIKMTFLDEREFEEELEKDSLGLFDDPRAKRK